jgi:hypothetical protein
MFHFLELITLSVSIMKSVFKNIHTNKKFLLLRTELNIKYMVFRYYPSRRHEDYLSNLDRHTFLYFEYHTIIIIEPIINPNSE